MLHFASIVTVSSLKVLRSLVEKMVIIKVLITMGKGEEISNLINESASWERDTCGSKEKFFFVDVSVESYHLNPITFEAFSSYWKRERGGEIPHNKCGFKVAQQLEKIQESSKNEIKIYTRTFDVSTSEITYFLLVTKILKHDVKSR